jgi:hypothetical protein
MQPVGGDAVSLSWKEKNALFHRLRQSHDSIGNRPDHWSYREAYKKLARDKRGQSAVREKKHEETGVSSLRSAGPDPRDFEDQEEELRRRQEQREDDFCRSLSSAKRQRIFVTRPSHREIDDKAWEENAEPTTQPEPDLRSQLTARRTCTPSEFYEVKSSEGDLREILDQRSKPGSSKHETDNLRAEDPRPTYNSTESRKKSRSKLFEAREEIKNRIAKGDAAPQDAERLRRADREWKAVTSRHEKNQQFRNTAVASVRDVVFHGVCARCAKSQPHPLPCKEIYEQCDYPRCVERSDVPEHAKEVCRILEHACELCSLRGHREDQCGGFRKKELRPARLAEFEAHADVGLYTRTRFRNAFRGFFFFGQTRYFKDSRVTNPGLDYARMLTGKKNLLHVIEELQRYSPEDKTQRFKFIQAMPTGKRSSVGTPRAVTDGSSENGC